MKYLMIVDDSVTIRSTIKLVVKDLGYSIKEAENGRDALDRVGEIKNSGDDIAFCIVDVNMPVMDGIKFVAEFRKTDHYTPIIMLTTESQESLIEEAKKLGASAWIIKPFQPDKLIEVIKRIDK